MEQLKRKRGGQQGNRNALKHGYYSKIFSKEEKTDFCSAGDIVGIDEEIALLRHVIKTAASQKDDKHLLLIIRAANALNKLIRTRAKVYGKQDGTQDAMENIVKEILAPLGLHKGSPQPNHEIPGGTNNENEIT